MIKFLTRNAIRLVVVSVLWSTLSSPEARASFSSLAKDTFSAAASSLSSATTSQKVKPDATVVRVVDGDTFIARTNAGKQIRIRLIGVDTPESTTKQECFGKKASLFTKGLLLPGTGVSITYGKGRLDKYGRTLAYVTTTKGVDVQRVLLQGGFARTMSIAPNTDRKMEFAALELAARAARVGLWGSCR
jgi:micrococcal nuclease